MSVQALAVAAALELYRRRPALGFSDCLMLELASKAGQLPLGTFDRALGKIEGTHSFSHDARGGMERETSEEPAARPPVLPA